MSGQRDIIVITLELAASNPLDMKLARTALLMGIRNLADELDASPNEVRVSADLLTKDQMNRRVLQRMAERGEPLDDFHRALLAAFETNGSPA